MSLPSDTPDQNGKFDAGPSIVELFHSAKKLLSLQSRVENRQLRKDNSKCQKNHLESSNPHKVFDGSSNKVLELLSPLSVDDIKNENSPYSKTSQFSNFNPKQPRGGSTNNITPSSMNDSPPLSSQSRSFDYDKDGSLSPSNKIKKEPSTTLYPVQISASKPSEKTALQNGPNHRLVQQHPKSNLTSSLSQQKHLLQSGSSNSDESDNNNNNNGNNNGNSTSFNDKPTECHNCHTLKTPLWRKDPQGNTLCNACGLFLKLHGTTRPLSLKTDVIKKRSSKRGSTGGMVRTNSVTENYLTSIGRQNNLTNPKPNSIPIKSNNLYGSSSTPGSFNSEGPLSISTNTSRYKNVLILPKPPVASSPAPTSSFSASSTPGTTVSSSFNPNSKSIPIPNGGSPFTNNNQPFKRKKSDVNIPVSYNEYANSISGESIKRIPSQLSISSKRNSFQSSSFNRRTSMTNLSSQNRKNSFVGLSNSLNGNTTPTNSLTPTNISLLNSKFSSSNSYFENPNSQSFHKMNSNINNQNIQNNHDTPGSDTSSSSHRQSFNHSFNQPPIRNDQLNVADLLPSNNKQSKSINEEDIAAGLQLPEVEFFKAYTSLNEDHDSDKMDIDDNVLTNKYTIKPTKSSLTDGLKNQNQRSSNDDEKDLDWLKFEI